MSALFFPSGCVTFLAVCVPRLLMPCPELSVGQDCFLNSFVLAAGSSGHWGAAQRQLCQLLSPMGAGLHHPLSLHSPGMQDLAPR